jgi:phosphatidylserine/phosphatidylglycerophosphate/cardiolipin synthase-like enzyme
LPTLWTEPLTLSPVHAGLADAHPLDYLQFYCLGNRETQSPADPPPLQPASRDSPLSRIQATRRFMVYVHSKMMIVDDEVRSGSSQVFTEGDEVRAGS